MSVSENLAVQMHQQDTDYYCGAACAQMVLETIGAGLLDQDDLYADNHSHSTLAPGWYTGQDGLQWTLKLNCHCAYKASHKCRGPARRDGEPEPSRAMKNPQAKVLLSGGADRIGISETRAGIKGRLKRRAY